MAEWQHLGWITAEHGRRHTLWVTCAAPGRQFPCVVFGSSSEPCQVDVSEIEFGNCNVALIFHCKTGLLTPTLKGITRIS